VTASFSGLKIPSTRLQNLKEEYSKPLSTSEARLIVVAQDRENGQCWVGLSVEQRCQLNRTPSINLDSETYKVGKMCTRSQVKSSVKDICATFVRDFSAQSK